MPEKIGPARNLLLRASSIVWQVEKDCHLNYTANFGIFFGFTKLFRLIYQHCSKVIRLPPLHAL